MSRRPVMPLWVADYIGDTMHLTLEQHGAYLLLLMHLWRRGGLLPAKRGDLARMLGISGHKWNVLAPAILPFFEITADGLAHGRITKELKRWGAFSEKRAQAGARGGRARANNIKALTLANASDLLQQVPKQTASNPLKKENKNLSPSSVVADIAREGARGLRVIEGGAGDAPAAPATGEPSQPGLADFTDPEDILP